MLVLLSALLIITPVSATLPDEATLDRFEQNGIYYYNPKGDNHCNSVSTTLQGANLIEKTWNFFISQGFNDAQTAGILGNAQIESSFSPTRASGSTYWGLFQWGGGRKEALETKLRAAGLDQYLSPTYWPIGAEQNIPEADLDQILQISLEHAMSEQDYNWQQELKTANTPEEAAEVFLVLFERAISGDSEVLYYAPFAGLLYQGTEQRREAAANFYQQYSGHGTTTNSAPTASKGANVTIIGDSLTVGATEALLTKFPELPTAQINAVSGRTWPEGIEAAKSTPLTDTVVFALGSNSTNLTQSDIDTAISTIGPDKTIVFVTNHGPGGYTGNNQLMRSATSNHDNIALADWDTTVSRTPELYLQSDGVHLTSAGNQLFAETIWKAINSNTNANGCSVSGEFTALALSYAWPEYHAPQYVDRMPDYATAVTQSLREGRYVGGSVAGVPGIDCGGFVTILTQNSGLASNYNGYNSNTGPQEKWVNDNGWTLLNGTSSTPIDTSLLQPGDIAFSGGSGYRDNEHTFIYVGEIPGFDSIIASASYSSSGTSGRAPMAGREDLINSGGGYVRWYRRP